MISSVQAPTTTKLGDVGGKAASLFRLQELGCSVPPFFVVTADGFRACPDGHMQQAQRDAVRNALVELGGDECAYAVRSSGIAEDLPDNSFAGVFDTILDMRGPDQVITAIERCWSSHKNAAATMYRAVRSVDRDDAMAVIVQKMVQPVWSGVCFTADPTTRALSTTVVNAVPGLGERLVSGTEAPEEIRVDTQSGRILERRSPGGGEQFPVHLLEAVVRELSRVASAMGFPQDLEWAIDGEQLILLQSRPITTLSGVYYNRALEPWGADANPDDPNRVWTRVYADEIWTPPVTPLFYDIQNLTGQLPLQFGMLGDHSGAASDIFKYFQAAAYLDSALVERLYVYQPKIMRLPSVLNMLPPERRKPFLCAPWKWRGTLHKVWLFEVTHGRSYGFTRNHKFLERAWPKFEQALVPLLSTDAATLDDKELDDYVAQVWKVAGTIGVECGITVFHYAHDLKLLLTALLERWCGNGEVRYAVVSGGLDASHTVRETDHIWQIAQKIRNAGSTELTAGQTESWAGFRKQFPNLDVVTEVENFLTRHGHRGANYKDPIYPRWGDDPELLWAQVQAFLADQSVRPNTMNSKSAAARVEGQTDAIRAVTGMTAPLKRALLRLLFKYNEIYVSIRDNHRFYYDQIWWLLRRVYVEKGRRLHRLGLLGNADDVFFLVRKEIAGLHARSLSAELAQLRIAVRREEWNRTRLEQPPKFLRRGYVPDNEPPHPLESALSFYGLAASAGQVTAEARVVYDVSDLGRVKSGEILVTRQTDPGWTPVFARLGGLVLETGGVLAHGASLCREFSVPCVTALENATSKIRDGDVISIDGGLGTVFILDRCAKQSVSAA